MKTRALLWSCEEVCLLANEGPGFKKAFERKAGYLDTKVRRSREVVHGWGTVARVSLPAGLELADPSAVFRSHGEGIRFENGYFWIDKAPTFYLNEARGVDPNVEWVVANEKGRRPVLYWRILCDIPPNDELLVRYIPNDAY